MQPWWTSIKNFWIVLNENQVFQWSMWRNTVTYSILLILFETAALFVNDALNYDCCGGLFSEGISRYSCSPPPSPVDPLNVLQNLNPPLSALYICNSERRWLSNLWWTIPHCTWLTAERRASWHITRAGKQPVTVEPAAALHHSSSVTVYDPSQAVTEWERSQKPPTYSWISVAFLDSLKISSAS